MRLKILIKPLFFLLLPLSALAQSDPGVYSARIFGLGGCSMTVHGIDALYYNPAGLAGLEQTAVHAGSASNFSLGSLTQVNAGLAVRTGEQSALFGRVSQFGFSSYQERVMSAGYAMRLEQNLSAAISFDLYQFAIDGYGSAMLPGFRIGAQYQPAQTISIGVMAQNPFEISTHDEITLPTRLSVGASYHPSEAASVYVEVEKDIDYSPRIRIAAEYRVIDILTLRLGVAGNPGTFHAGIGLQVLEKLRIDVAAGYHQVLGFSPAIGLAFSDFESGK